MLYCSNIMPPDGRFVDLLVFNNAKSFRFSVSGLSIKAQSIKNKLFVACCTEQGKRLIQKHWRFQFPVQSSENSGNAIDKSVFVLLAFQLLKESAIMHTLQTTQGFKTNTTQCKTHLGCVHEKKKSYDRL